MMGSSGRLKNITLSLPVLLCPAVVGAAIVVSLLVSPLLVYGYPVFDNLLVQMLARQLQGQEIKRSLALSLAETYGLSWLYVSDEDGKTLLEFAPITPALASTSNRSRPVTYHDRPFYEAVAMIEDGLYLHAGLRTGSAINSGGQYALTNPLLFAIVPVRGANLVVILLFATALLECLILLFVTRPIDALKNGISSMTKSGTIDLPSYDAVQLPKTLVTEVQDLKEAMRAIFVYLEKVKQDVIVEQEKLTRWKKQKTELENVATAGSAAERVALSGDTLAGGMGLSGLIEAKGSSASYADQVARLVVVKYSEAVDGVIFVRESFGDRQAPSIVSTCGVSAELKERFERIELGQLLAQARLTAKIVDLGPLTLKKFGLEGLLQGSTVRHIVVAPILHKRKALGYLLVLAPQTLPESILANLERACNYSAGIYFGLLLHEESEEQKWTDPLTGLRNKAYLVELLSHMTASIQDARDAQYAVASFCLSLEPSQQSESLTGAMLERVVPVLRQVIDSAKRQALGGGLPADLELEIVKGAELEFVLTAAKADRKAYQALTQVLAQQLQPILNSVSPPAKLCLGLSLYPGAGDSGEDLLTRSRVAMYFAEEHGQSPVALLKAEAVPADFRPSRRLTAMKGQLGVLDTTELLQSIASGSRSGVLIVDDGFGKEFSMTVGAGKPVAASLGKLVGQDAVIEFVVTFDAGSFNFKETAVDDSAPGKRLPPLMNMLMESAMAQDHYHAARSVLRSIERPVVKGANIALWTELIDKSDVSEREYSIMQTLVALVGPDASLTLEKMFARIDNCPTHVKWRSAALLHSYGAIDFV
jgi:GGDEF domain-containing protein